MDLITDPVFLAIVKLVMYIVVIVTNANALRGGMTPKKKESKKKPRRQNRRNR